MLAVLPRIAAEALREAQGLHNVDAVERQTRSESEIQWLTDRANIVGASRAADEFNAEHRESPVARTTVSKYLNYFKANKRYFEAEKRGRKNLLTEEENEMWLKALTHLRRRSECIDATLACCIARGIVKRTRKRAFEEGAIKVSEQWARDTMREAGFRVRRGTTDRTVTCEEVRKAGIPYFQELSTKKVKHQALVLNLDEFFCKLSNNQQTWTWTRTAGGAETKSVPIRQDKLGFTCTLVCSPEGIELLQLIWEGKTVASTAEGPGHPRIYQTTREGSHFQNASTFSELIGRVIDLVRNKRSHLGLPPDEPALLIFDYAGQHDGVVERLRDNNIEVQMVPKKMTHVFQPADQYAICSLKKRTTTGWKQWVETLFADNTIEEAVATMTCRSAPVRRKVKYALIREALDSLDGMECRRSFEVAGILRCLFQEVPSEPIVFDDYIVGEGEATDAQPCEEDDEAEADAAAEIDVDAPQERPKKKLREEVKGVDYVLVIHPAPLGRPPKPWSAIAKEHQKAQKLKKRQSAFPGGIWSKFKKANLHDID